ncbi:EcsC family protein [Thalassobacillus sp. CUG 92003]|uniref:EcsC family protein n=1 Tax=Thalassobacillus sp. CUG 92003 TaxID=2736641 RepID=UPI0015E6D507|nr:EcsC family protein [Thalassobacillus sp. CUG 92003]
MSCERVLKDIQAWQLQYSAYEPNDFEMIYDDWIKESFRAINPGVKAKFFSKIDNWLFHSHAFLQGTAYQKEARLRLLNTGSIFNTNIEKIEDMKTLSIDQLTYIAEQQVAKGKLYAFAQGGITGSGGLLLLGIDFPLMLIMNLRVVQLIGLSFGHEMNRPFEMMLSLKLFHAATLPKRLQAAAWEGLVREIEQQSHAYIYEGAEEITDESWLDQPLKQAIKSMFILMFRRKIFQSLPIISMGIGAVFNYQLTRQVTEFSLRFYQYRYILEKGE